MIQQLIRPHKGVSLYYKVAEVLREQIQSGRLRPGERLPSEEELCKLFRVSRTTLRAALGILASEGLIRREQGRGTYVTEPKFEQTACQLLSFSKEMKQRGLKPGAQVLAVEKIPADEQIARKLNINCGELVIMLKRLRLADGEPMGIQIAYIPFSLCPDLVNEDLSQSLYELLSKKFNINLHKAKDIYYAGTVNPEEAKLLGIPQGSPVFIVERVTFTAQGTAVEYVRSTMRGDRYKVSLLLTGSNFV